MATSLPSDHFVRPTATGWTKMLAWSGPVLLGLVIAACSVLASSSALGEALVRNTVRLSLLWYFAALWLLLDPAVGPDDVGPVDSRMSGMRAGGREAAGATVRHASLWFTARWCWTWAVVTFLVHVAMAFHFYHNWSHQHAFERTRQVSGVGEGIFVSYFFTLVWSCDALAWWIAPRAYANRPRWVAVALHVFLLFIVLNGTIVFESGAIRWAAAGVIGLLAVRYWKQRVARDSRGGPASSASQG